MAPKRPQWQKHASAFLNKRLERGVSCASYPDFKTDLVSYVTAKVREDVPEADFSDPRGTFRRWTDTTYSTMDEHLLCSRLSRVVQSQTSVVTDLQNYHAKFACCSKWSTLPYCALEEPASGLHRVQLLCRYPCQHPKDCTFASC